MREVFTLYLLFILFLEKKVVRWLQIAQGKVLRWLQGGYKVVTVVTTQSEQDYFKTGEEKLVHFLQSRHSLVHLANLPITGAKLGTDQNL